MNVCVADSRRFHRVSSESLLSVRCFGPLQMEVGATEAEAKADLAIKYSQPGEGHDKTDGVLVRRWK